MADARQRAADASRLNRGLEQLSLDLSTVQRDALLDYLALLRHWGRTYNLVARGGRGDLVTRHVLDSLAILQHLPSGALLDVGSGAGFPGLPIAISDPTRAVTLLDSNGKKVRFLSHVIRELGLSQAEAVHERVEKFDATGEFAVITSRAFSTLANFVDSAGHLADNHTCLAAMKGQAPDREIAELPATAKVNKVITLTVPGLDEQRHLVLLSMVPDQSTTTQENH